MGSALEAIRSKTYYEILHLERDASSDQIKDSYKEIAKLYHPDSNFYTEIIQDPLSAEENEVFQFITLAYTTLLNAEKRAAYDKTLPPLLKGWEDPGAQTEPGVEKRRPAPARGSGAIDIGKFKNALNAQEKSHILKKRSEVEKRKVAVLIALFTAASLLCAGTLIFFLV